MRVGTILEYQRMVVMHLEEIAEPAELDGLCRMVVLSLPIACVLEEQWSRGTAPLMCAKEVYARIEAVRVTLIVHESDDSEVW